METTTTTSDDVTSAEKIDEAATTDKANTAETGQNQVDPAVEHGGPKGPEPTRYGDWEKGGRCTDF